MTTKLQQQEHIKFRILTDEPVGVIRVATFTITARRIRVTGANVQNGERVEIVLEIAE